VWHHWLEALLRDHTLIRYDERGCGLSDWTFEDFSFDAWLHDLETMIDANGPQQPFSLLGISQGAPIAMLRSIRRRTETSGNHVGYRRSALQRSRQHDRAGANCADS
jgi:pimeloyl-ACP methyl ester carboxylesterase